MSEIDIEERARALAAAEQIKKAQEKSIVEAVEEEVKTENAENQSTEIATQPTFQEKALTEVNFNDVKFKLDTSKDFEKQVEDVLGGVVTASAVQDAGVQKELKEKKAEELVNKARTKANKAQEDAIKAETEVQKAERDLYEAVLNTFGIFKHLPRFLMKILVWILSPLYTVLSILIGLPCAFVKILIDNLDGIICRYEKTADGTKPKIKVVSWMLFSVLVLGIIALTVLKCLGKI